MCGSHSGPRVFAARTGVAGTVMPSSGVNVSLEHAASEATAIAAIPADVKRDIYLPPGLDILRRSDLLRSYLDTGYRAAPRGR